MVLEGSLVKKEIRHYRYSINEDMSWRKILLLGKAITKLSDDWDVETLSNEDEKSDFIPDLDKKPRILHLEEAEVLKIICSPKNHDDIVILVKFIKQSNFIDLYVLEEYLIKLADSRAGGENINEYIKVHIFDDFMDSVESKSKWDRW